MGDLVLRQPLFEAVAAAGHVLVLVVKPALVSLAERLVPDATIVPLPCDAYDPVVPPAHFHSAMLVEELRSLRVDMAVVTADRSCDLHVERKEACAGNALKSQIRGRVALNRADQRNPVLNHSVGDTGFEQCQGLRTKRRRAYETPQRWVIGSRHARCAFCCGSASIAGSGHPHRFDGGGRSGRRLLAGQVRSGATPRASALQGGLLWTSSGHRTTCASS
jgi:hypothetical protein